MAKDRNTVAKRQREVEKKRKADEKRERRARRRRESDEPSGETSPDRLSPGELEVLSTFRSYLMAPGSMLCFGQAEREAFEVPLARMTDKGLLVAERFPGGYSLTRSGFAAMKKTG